LASSSAHSLWPASPPQTPGFIERKRLAAESSSHYTATLVRGKPVKPSAPSHDHHDGRSLGHRLDHRRLDGRRATHANRHTASSSPAHNNRAEGASPPNLVTRAAADVGIPRDQVMVLVVWITPPGSGRRLRRCYRRRSGAAIPSTHRARGLCRRGFGYSGRCPAVELSVGGDRARSPRVAADGLNVAESDVLAGREQDAVVAVPAAMVPRRSPHRVPTVATPSFLHSPPTFRITVWTEPSLRGRFPESGQACR